MASKKLPVPPKGWKYNEFGELVPRKGALNKAYRSKKAASAVGSWEVEILDVAMKKASQDIQEQEDLHTFRMLDRATLTDEHHLLLGDVLARVKRFRQSFLSQLSELEQKIEDDIIRYLKPPPPKPVQKRVKKAARKKAKKKR